MSRKKPSAKGKQTGHSQTAITAETLQLPPAGLSRSTLKILLAAVITLLALILYAQTAGYGYTLDDGSVIVQNKLVQKGFGGLKEILATDYWYGYSDQLRGLQYRPASLFMFALEEGFFPGNTSVHHIVNVLLYALTCLLLFLLFCKIFKKHNLLLPFISILLFTAHPLHTEVVSNIKSRDEILCFLFGLAAVCSILKYYSGRNILYLILGGLAVFLSITSKETGIAFVLLVPVVLYIARDTTPTFLVVTTLTLVAAAGIYLIIRHFVVKDVSAIDLLVIDNSLVAAQTNAEKLATAFYILLRYIGLLLVPHPLSYDYSFSQVGIVSLADPKALMAIALYLTMGIFAILNLRKKNLYAFAILLYLLPLAPVSNIFLKIGSTMAERFLYMPSLGFCVFVALVLVKLTRANLFEQGIFTSKIFFKKHVAALSILGVIGLLYSIKTVSRNRDWKDNIHLFGRDVHTSPNSARTHYNWGLSNVYDLYLKETDAGLKKEYLEEGKRELEISLQIYPEYFEAEKPLGYVLLKQGAYDKAIFYFDQYLQRNPTDVATLNNKAAALMALQQYQAAIPVLETALKKEPADTSTVKNLGRCYAYINQFEKAARYFLKSIELAPSVAENYRLTGMAYQFMGDTTKAKAYLAKAAVVP
jgi:tetratricopeptide (TPR) repeat protein